MNTAVRRVLDAAAAVAAAVGGVSERGRRGCDGSRGPAKTDGSSF